VSREGEKPRIALIVPDLAGGGGVPAVARFLKDTLQKSGTYQLKLISLATSSGDATHARITRPSSWWRGPSSSQHTWEGLPFEHVGAVAGEIEFQRYHPRRILASLIGDCDVLQVVSGSPAWACAVCGLGKPVSLQCATRAAVERRRQHAKRRGLKEWWRRRMTRFTDRIDDRALRTVDAIQVENPWMLEYARRVNGDRVVDLRYAPPGIDAAKFRPAEGRRAGRSAPVLCVGRLDDPRKNVGLLLEACSRMTAEERTDLRLVLAGQAGPPETFWQQAKALGIHEQIEFIHRPTEEALVALYQQAGVFVLPSDEEGLGVVLLEAMGCGAPVVSTRSGGPEGIITDGSDGFLVPLDDAGALAERIARLRSDADLNLMMGRRARKTVEERYAAEVAGRPFLEVWDLLARKGGRN
jgi:D-inositol-3-phosphate glycosyltransferase